MSWVESEWLAGDKRALLGPWPSLQPVWLWLIPTPEPFRARSKHQGKILSFAELFRVSPALVLNRLSPLLTKAMQVRGATA